jgi:signal transduction histidine kinase
MSKNSCAEDLARDCVRARFELRRAAQVLHDQVGSLLAVAGLRLQLLRMDHPETETLVAEVGQALESVMDRVRTLTRELEPSPVRRTGLKNALQDLAEAGSAPLQFETNDATNGRGIALRYTATAVLPPEIADALYDAIASSAASAKKSATHITISVSGSRSITARVAYDGRPKNAGRDLAAVALLARHAGLQFQIKPFSVTTKRGTIVAIRYGIQRSPRG